MRRTATQFQIYPELLLHVIPGFVDNYFYILEEQSRAEAAIIDPGDAAPVVQVLRERGLNLKFILLTHHHGDHTGGVEQLVSNWPECTIVSSPWLLNKKIQQTKNFRSLKPKEIYPLWNFSVSYLDVRGHTLDHIAFALQQGSDNSISDVFVGDALFGAGCGGLFEGTFPQMLEALKQIRSLPPQSRLWCAHEYTLKNLRVAVQLGEENPDQLMRLAALEKESALKNLEPHELMTLPLILSIEKKTNPFLRWDCETLQNAIDSQDELETFRHVRLFRDKF